MTGQANDNSADDNTELLARIGVLRARVAAIPGPKGEQMARQLDYVAEQVVMGGTGVPRLAAVVGLMERLLDADDSIGQFKSTSPLEKLGLAREALARESGLVNSTLDDLSGVAAQARDIFKSIGRAVRAPLHPYVPDVPDIPDPGVDPLDDVLTVLDAIATAAAPGHRDRGIWEKTTEQFGRLVAARFGGPEGLAAAILALHPASIRRTRAVGLLLGDALRWWPNFPGPFWPGPIAEVLPHLLNGLAGRRHLIPEMFRAAATANPNLMLAEFGPDSSTPLAAPLAASTRTALRALIDDLVIDLATNPAGDPWEIIGYAGPLRGTQFLLPAIRLCAWSHSSANRRYNISWVPKVAVKLLGAQDIDPQPGPVRDRVLATLREQSGAVRDSLLAAALMSDEVPSVLAESLGWPDAAPLLSLFTPALDGMATSPDPAASAIDVTRLRAAIAAVPEDQASAVLAWMAGNAEPLREHSWYTRDGHATSVWYDAHPAQAFEMLAAAATGRNRAEVDATRLARPGMAHTAVRAYGLLPLDGGAAEVRGRYRALKAEQEIAGSMGPNRRVEHTRAVRAALSHLAQVAGYASAHSLEWAMAAAEPASGEVQLSSEGTATRALRGMPDPQPVVPGRPRERARALLEAALAEQVVLQPGDLRHMLAVPAARDMLAALIVRAPDGRTGILERGTERVVGLSGTWPLPDSPVTIAHPLDLDVAGELEMWRDQVVRRGIGQPVEQVHREFFRPGAQSRAEKVYTEFDGKPLVPDRAREPLGRHGWRTESQPGAWLLARLVRPGLRAELHFDGILVNDKTDLDEDLMMDGEMDGIGVAAFGMLCFYPGTRAPAQVPYGRGEPLLTLGEVPPLLYSEIIRDLTRIAAEAAPPPDYNPYADLYGDEDDEA